MKPNRCASNADPFLQFHPTGMSAAYVVPHQSEKIVTTGIRKLLRFARPLVNAVLDSTFNKRLTQPKNLHFDRFAFRQSGNDAS
jgi:hypothetical protein